MKREEFNINIPRMGFFIVVKGRNDFISCQIKKAQREAGFSEEDSQYTHVMTSGGGQWAVSAVMPKLKVVDITKAYRKRYIKIVAYKGRNYMLKKRYKVAFWAATLNHSRYDWLGVLRFKIRWLFNKKDWWFCSESCLYALQKEYPHALHKKPAECMPADFLNKDYFRIVWEGVIP